MPKKAKTGKQRKDAYYHKAKIAGFRARSAYKLIQLNTKYEFLQKSRVCVDLCAAPGSWMQVAKKHMPVSSIIVGVDLFPIKSIPGALTIVGDITTEKVRQELKATLKTWKADLILHDGAPNVGQNWLHDAYQQNLLVLHAFKLACELLQKGGTFVTKVFRSKDYFNLEYIFRKLFRKVEVTKPQASRYESAEIFVLCQGYLNPAKIDPQFFSAKHVFQEIEQENKSKLNILKPVKGKPKPEGFPEGATTLYNKVPITKFIHSTNFIEVLQEASELVFDDEVLKNHTLTTETIIENCKDIKVLGRKDLRSLLSWRKSIRAEMKKKTEELAAQAAAAEKLKEKEEEKSEGEEEEQELDKLQKQIIEMKTQQAQDEKRSRKRKLKERKKLEEKLRLKSVIPGDEGPTEGTEGGLFNLERLAQVQSMDTIVDQDADMVISESEEEEGPEGPSYMRVSRGENKLDRTARYYLGKDGKEIGDDDDESDSGSDEEGLGLKKDKKLPELETGGDIGENADIVHPLITDLVGDSRTSKRERKAEDWFSQDVFKDLETEADEDYELEAAITKYKADGGKVMMKTSKKAKQKKEAEGSESGYTSDHEEEAELARDAPDTDSDSDTDSDAEEEKVQVGPDMPRAAMGGGGSVLEKSKKRKKESDELDPVGLALATKMIHSKKAKRDITDAGWNRYMFGDEDDLPDWFSKDEKKFNQPRIEVEPEDLRMYRNRSKDVNVRSIKKVVEAKARKQRRVKKRMEKARKKSENVTNNAELSEREKSEEVKKLYKNAMAPLKRKERTYVVMKKRHGGQKPKGTKGPYKLVDRRLKKDTRGEKKADAKKRNPKRPTKPTKGRKKY